MRNPDYAVLIEPLSEEDGGGFVATVPDLPGCMSDGDTREAAAPEYRGRHRLLARRGKGARPRHPSAETGPAHRLRWGPADQPGAAECVSSVHDAERLEDVRTERVDERNIGGVASTRDQDAADARHVVARVEGVPLAAEEHVEPGVEIHRRRVRRHADVAEIAVAVARRNVHATAERDREMREIAAYADPFDIGFIGRARRPRALIAERDMAVDEIADRLHPRASRAAHGRNGPRRSD